MKKLIVLKIFVISLGVCSTFESTKAELENKARALAQEMENIYGRRC